MTKGDEWRLILAFALPMMATNLLQSAYALADSVILGNFIGPDALGSAGLVATSLWFMQTICQGIGTGVSVLAAQYYGAGRRGDIAHVVGAAYSICAVLGPALTFVCFACARPLVEGFLIAPAELRGMSIAYFTTFSIGITFQMIYNATYGLLRSHGDSRGGLIFLLISSFVNISLDLLFVVRFGWGVRGAAAATVISQACSAGASMIYMARGFPSLRPRIAIGASEREKARTAIRLSMPIIAVHAIYSVGFTILQRLVNSFGAPSIEGFIAMGRIEDFVHVAPNALSSAVSAFAGQNVGAGMPERARAGYIASLKIGGVITIAASILTIVFGSAMLGTFGISGEAMRRGHEHLVLLMCFMMFSMTSTITSGFLQGTGDVRVPMVSGSVNLTIRLGLSFLMAGTFVGFRSVYVSMPPAALAGFAIVVLRYRSGKWRDKSVVRR